MQICFTHASHPNGYLRQRLVSKHVCSGHDSLKKHLKIKLSTFTFTPVETLFPFYGPAKIEEENWQLTSMENPSARDVRVFLRKFPLLESLEVIDVWSPEVYSAIVERPGLTSLSVKNNNSYDPARLHPEAKSPRNLIQALEFCPDLQSLTLNDKVVRDVSLLERCSNLTHLDVRGCTRVLVSIPILHLICNSL